jgi:hypothetical protein
LGFIVELILLEKCYSIGKITVEVFVFKTSKVVSSFLISKPQLDQITVHNSCPTHGQIPKVI